MRHGSCCASAGGRPLFRLFFRPDCITQRDCLHSCVCRNHRLAPTFRPGLELLEQRIPPGFFAVANPLATTIGLNSLGLVSSEALTSNAHAILPSPLRGRGAEGEG